MKVEEKILKRIIQKCIAFARNLSYHRSFRDLYKNFKLNFWIAMHNNAIDIAVLDWTCLFSYPKDDLHWQKCVLAKKEFKINLLKHLEIDEIFWESYCKRIKDYRDKDIAHVELFFRDSGDFREKTEMPIMDIALKAANFYYCHVLRNLRTHYKEYALYNSLPNSLIDDYFNKSLRQSIKIATISCEATQSLKEKVW